ncbi:MAG: glycogen/starch/alpha-glucan phosphorylase [Clostridia bacterium]|nr:glycogen/starch/alpha-glucan phosphorylase [Clostridia bacterium]
MLKKQQVASLEKRLDDYLNGYYNVDISRANDKQLYYALAQISNQLIHEKRIKVAGDKNKSKKIVHYMSIEFLLGRNLKNNLWNLGIEEAYDEILTKYEKNLQKVYLIEKDAGLGNGGLGRLAACYLDSLATLEYPAFGHCIKYENGLFNQKIVEGKQIETPDEWLDTGSVWLTPREDKAVDVLIGGEIKQNYSEYGLSYDYEGSTVIRAVPYDMMISGYNSNTASTLRLWEAKAVNGFDNKKFQDGDYEGAIKVKNAIENINRVLYPADNREEGKALRLIQQYFLASAAVQNILNDFFLKHTLARHIPRYVSIHINDTHPVLCIPEMMRLLMDKYGMGWDDSWSYVKNTISYTNHTVLSEALEVKSMKMIEKYIPRIALILRELDRRFRIELGEFFKNDYRKIEQMAIISGDNVYMANLAVYASYAVNGVAKIHSHILKTKLFQDYAEIFSGRFTNITNGVTQRRWLAQANPKLDKFITSLIGNGYYTRATELTNLLKFINDDAVLNNLHEIKLENKKRFAEYLQKTQQIEINPNARFDVQVKRIHEYKRQLMNALRIIYLMCQIRNNPNEEVVPQVFIFSGKAAPGYYMAKRIIKLINQISVEIDNDPLLSSKIKVVFVENYSVSVAELLMPATEVSQQISLAGREASGTGNMKAVFNGALMMCTVDGANIEIADEVGHENVFEFGLTADEVEKIKSRGYNATDYYIGSERVRMVLDKLSDGVGGENFTDIVDYLLGHSNYQDAYMCLADFDSYIDAHYKMDACYKDQIEWNKKSLKAIASMGYFSSDRAIEDYASRIWNLKKNEE